MFGFARRTFGANHPVRLLCEMKRFCCDASCKNLAEAEEFAYLAYVAAVNDGCVVEVALLLLRLLGQDVTVVSVVSFDLTRSSENETLLGTGISLNFWHFLCVLIDY